ncbi:MAG: hypothetical protein J7K58_03040 [Euryarchaeota archaeon]|nr:hypothetical protein [Euryarchaeota archaeon]
MRILHNGTRTFTLSEILMNKNIGYLMAILVLGVLIRVYLIFSPMMILEGFMKYNLETLYPLQKVLYTYMSVFQLRVVGIISYVITLLIIWFLVYEDIIDKTLMASFVTIEPHFLLYSIFDPAYYIPFTLFLTVYGLSRRMPPETTKAIIVGMLIGFSMVFSPHVVFYLSLMYLVRVFASIYSLRDVSLYVDRLKDVHEKLGRVRGYLNVAKSDELKRRLKDSERRLTEISQKYVKSIKESLSAVTRLVSPLVALTIVFTVITATVIALPFGLENVVKVLFWFPMYFLGGLKQMYSLGYISLVRVLLYFPAVLLAIYFILLGECKSDHGLAFLLFVLVPLNPHIGAEDLLIPIYLVFEVITLNKESLKDIMAKRVPQVVVMALVVLSLYQTALTIYATPFGYEPITRGAFLDMSAISRAFEYSLQNYEGYPMFDVKEDARNLEYYLIASGYIVDPRGNILVTHNTFIIEEHTLSYAYVGDVKYTFMTGSEFIKPSVYFTRHGIQSARAIVALKISNQ